MFAKTFSLLLLLLGATALASQAPYLRDSTTESLSTSSSQSPSPSPSPAAMQEEYFPAVAPPQAAEAALIEPQVGSLQPPLGAEDGLRRRLVTYDQRQEGQYNIRADLENFMIVLIPPGPQEGLSLLDLLTKSSLRGATKSNGKRKHADASALKSFYQRQQQLQQQQQMPQAALGVTLPEFIEGRTPYHVDISGASEELQQQQQPRLHRQQVDVLPPQLIPMPQLIKPYHLEAEAELIQALPPVPASASSSAGNNLLEGFNQAGSQYYRHSRSLRGDSFLDTNRLTPEPVARSNARSISVPLYRSDVARANVLYPPIDVPAYIVNEAHPRNWQLDDEPTPILPKHLVDADVLSFQLLGDALANSKTLLRDGQALCAPGQRRDSYGACRQVEGY
ncbi:uncharacterized protein [Drosophila virilis]|uniref:DUF4794 domain-containing protein n=1 Tax=Drosophila virilis TaxID=7244 RepID=B4M905_DROVI|nr:uncharacterized protein LOC6633938 [Drosophila virilis]EDW57681.1 uncharacterized protein Dvir_GJ18225 [Drosophila virilis]